MEDYHIKRNVLAILSCLAWSDPSNRFGWAGGDKVVRREFFGAAEPISAAVGKAGPALCYPNPALTPGVTNPQVTQETVATTIAVSGWTATIRPHVSVTSIIKDHIMARDGLIGPASLYELDHFISLELGGHPSDIGNLWCQPYAPSGMGAHEKDHVENWLKTQVVTGVMTLAKAQEIITTDWYDCYLHLSKMGLLPEMVSFDPDGSSDPDDEG